MKAILLVLLMVTLTTYTTAQTDPYQKQWSRVYKYELNDLPQSALTIVDTIYRQAKAANNIPQITKALIYQSKFALTLQEDAELIVVRKLTQEINTASVPLRNILESMIAHMYWQYFERNRFTYYNRSRTATLVNASDFRTWDAKQMFLEIHRHYQNSLQNAPQLQKISLSTIQEILAQGNGSKILRPTLFDFLTHNALEFYQTNESGSINASGQFKLTDERYFTDFENAPLTHPDSTAPLLLAIKLYKSLLDFHRRDREPVAYIQAEIERLQLLKKQSLHPQADSLYLYALKKLKATYSHFPVSTQVDFEIASLLFEQGESWKNHPNNGFRFKLKEALAICEQAIRQFPNGEGTEKCRALHENILLPKVELTAEQFIPIGLHSKILVTYTSIDSMMFAAYRIPHGFAKRFGQIGNDSTLQAMLKQLTATAQWKVQLQKIADYQPHRTEVVVPPLQQGEYLLVANMLHFDKKHPPLFAIADLQCTDLAVIKTTQESTHRYQVVNRNSGNPVEGATIHVTDQQHSTSTPTLIDRLVTNREGFAELKRTPRYYYDSHAAIRYQNDSMYMNRHYLPASYSNYDEAKDLIAHTYMFSDRSIYRPGQTIYFKGILIKKKGKQTTVVAGEFVNVVLEDANSKEVASLRLKSNAFGSFSGEFKLPASGITGEYELYADEDDESDTKFYDQIDDFESNPLEVSIEEYKRPTFEVVFKPVTQTFRINDTVTVSGNATAYQGSKISNASFTYRIKRLVRFPDWYYWRNTSASRYSEEIADGEGTTQSDGSWHIDFTAIPDESIDEKTLPIFRYEITIDVTDINGETRSATTEVNVGYHTIAVSLQTPAVVAKKSNQFAATLSVKNLNGQPAHITGSIHVYKVRTPASPQRKRVWDAPDAPLLSEAAFASLFPHETYGDEEEHAQQNKGVQKAESPFDTRKSNEVIFQIYPSWEAGNYLMELIAVDSAGNRIIEKKMFRVDDSATKVVPDQQLLVFELDQPSYHVGDVARLKVGSASRDVTLTIDIESNQQITHTRVIHFSGNFSEITIPVTAKMGNGFSVTCSGVVYNSFIHSEKTVPIIAPDTRLEWETISFQDKLQPSGRQMWSFVLKGKEAPQLEAEILASMYDASLDQFKPHAWSWNPIPKNRYYRQYQPSGEGSFGIEPFRIHNRFFRNYRLFPQFFDQFDWFGFTITNHPYEKKKYLERLYNDGHTSGKASSVSLHHAKDVRTGYVRGTLRTSDGDALPGVNVLIQGTTTGTVTDQYGTYTIQANRGDVLVYSFIGYVSASATVTRKNTMDVTMEEDITQLAEVIVTSYGVVSERKALGFAQVSTVENETYKFTTLHGKVAGVQIAGSSGAAYGIQLRGVKTLSANEEPLYVVDGVPVESLTISEQDIQSIEVLQGEAATALYGSRAINGVVIITTKSGQRKLDEALAKVNVRTNFNETAFFFPHLRTDEEGKIQFTFTTPDALTRWKLQLLAHTKDLKTSTQVLQAVTQKELMITPNASRFLRVGDELIFSAKISNLSSSAQAGDAVLQLTDAVTNQPVDVRLGNSKKYRTFQVKAKDQTVVSWKLKIPDGIGALQYKIIAKAGHFSDGEQNIVPVFSNQVLITEAMPMQVRGGQIKKFSLDKMRNTDSPTRQHHQLTFELTSNPVWYAIQALPYLMEFPHECAEQTFARYYANCMAAHLVDNYPQIKQVFDQWASSSELVSALEKNPELKSIIVQETPWLRDAQNESEQKKRIALLFDLQQSKDQLQRTAEKLQKMQLPNGGFPWFSGSEYASQYITLHIVSGLGHLKKLHMESGGNLTELVDKALAYLDQELVNDYAELMQKAKLQPDWLKEQQVSHVHIQYLYMRSFYPEKKPTEVVAQAIAYYEQQAQRYWKNFNLYDKAMIAVIHLRNNQLELAQGIIQSLRESSIRSEEMGMYWKENVAGWYWNEAPVETQALLIEAFSEMEATGFGQPQAERQAISEMQLWLLKNKQTSEWKTTKATTEAIYALLLRNTNALSTENPIDVKVGGHNVPIPADSEAGSGHFKSVWKKDAITSAMGEVEINNRGKQVAWGALYWQYLEDIDRVTPAESPLRIAKKVFVVTSTTQGDLLTEVSAATPVQVGQRIRIRMELTTDRYMEFVSLKDMRAAGLEPIDVLSEYKWQNKLGYYQSTRDASTYFFFDSIPKGVYVIEYDVRANNKGDYSNGFAILQSMYAPEFTSHSQGLRITIK